MKRKRVEAGILGAWHGGDFAVVGRSDCGYIDFRGRRRSRFDSSVPSDGFVVQLRSDAMKVSDILRVKGVTLFTVAPEQPLADAAKAMAEHDIGSLVVMSHGDLVGMLTFREVILAIVRNGGTVGTTVVRSVMDDHPLTCTPETSIDEVRRMMLGRHARYMPVLDQRTLMGVISFHDVAKAVVDGQDFENRMLKAYIRDWPVEQEAPAEPRL
jgi:CBS domain-containing protein